MNSRVCIEPHYLGGIEYFSLLSGFEEIQLECYDHFVKQTYRNRTTILTANGKLNLIVPVHYDNRTISKDVRIDYNQTWLNDHLRAIQAAYSKSPFFEHLFDKFESVWNRRPEFLYDLSVPLMTICLELLGLEMRLIETHSYQKELPEGILDIRNQILPKTETDWNKFYQPIEYIQNFGNNFVEGLSILDILMCTGNEASTLVSRSTTFREEQMMG